MEIKDVIRKQGIFEMVYTKPDGITTHYFIADIQLSGQGYIKAYSCKSGKHLTFKIERIQTIQESWTPLSKGDIAPESGLYVFVYEGDNHLDFEAFELLKGERFLKYFIGEYSHGGFMDRLPFAYHYTEVYNPQIKQDEWITPADGRKDNETYNNHYSCVRAVETPQGECAYYADFFAGILFAWNQGKYTLKAVHYFYDPRNACEWLMSKDYEDYENYYDYYAENDWQMDE